MKRRLLLQTAFMLFSICSWAQGPNNTETYYQAADGKMGAELKTAMSVIINTGKNDISYNGLWEAYATTDVRADGFLRDWYSNTTSYVIGGPKQGASYSAEGDAYNREHTIPQSWFSKNAPMVSDLIQVVPTDGYVNNRRSNWPFAEVANVTYQSNGGYCKLGSSKTSGYNGTAFEPNDEIKGDLARIYFYMATCYESQCAGWTAGEGNYVFSNENLGLKNWVVDMFMAWSKLDPVDDVEIARNNAIQTTVVKVGNKYKSQNNRNPFVDYPGLEDYIWGDKQDVAFSYDNYNAGEQSIVARPTFTPDAGTYYESVEVTISCKTDGAAIYYTTNGEDASEQSILYEGPFTLSELGTYTVKAVAILDGERSAQSEATYTITESGGGGGGETPADCEIALNNTFFGTNYGGTISDGTTELTGSQNGVSVVYQKGSGQYFYCNNTEIRLYSGNELTISVGQGTLTSIEFGTGQKTATLNANVGTLQDNTWTGDAMSVTITSGGTRSIPTLKINVNGGQGPSGIDFVQTTTNLDGQRVIYDLSGRRVTNPTRGIYIVDGRKVVIK